MLKFCIEDIDECSKQLLYQLEEDIFISKPACITCNSPLPGIDIDATVPIHIPLDENSVLSLWTKAALYCDCISSLSLSLLERETITNTASCKPSSSRVVIDEVSREPIDLDLYGIAIACRQEGATVRSGIDIDNSETVTRLQMNQRVYFDRLMPLKGIPGETVAIQRVRIIDPSFATTNIRFVVGWASLTGRTPEDQEPILTILQVPKLFHDNDVESVAATEQKTMTTMHNIARTAAAAAASSSSSSSSSLSSYSYGDKFHDTDSGSKQTVVRHVPMQEQPIAPQQEGIDRPRKVPRLDADSQLKQLQLFREQQRQQQQQFRERQQDFQIQKQQQQQKQSTPQQQQQQQAILDSSMRSYQSTYSSKAASPSNHLYGDGNANQLTLSHREQMPSNWQKRHFAKSSSHTKNGTKAVSSKSIGKKDSTAPALQASQPVPLMAARSAPAPLAASAGVIQSNLQPSKNSQPTIRNFTKPISQTLFQPQQNHVGNIYQSTQSQHHTSTHECYSCPICDMNMTLWDVPARNHHVNQCTRELEDLESAFLAK